MKTFSPFLSTYVRRVTAVVGCSAFILAIALSLHAQTETVLYNLNGTSDGKYPFGTLTFDSSGNLYGTSLYGGDFTNCPSTGCGAIWEISPGSGGVWTETVLHTFAGGTDGATPYAGLVADGAGNLYGATAYGGNSHATQCHPQGCGVIFELSPALGGGWTETILHAFSGGRDGNGPWSGLIFDSAGNLYGSTFSGGELTGSACAPYGCGVVFELSPTSTGWKETILHAFAGGNQGQGPFGTLLFDSTGNLYGTNTEAGYVDCSCGVVFKLAPVTGGWKETVLHTFTGPNGNDSQAGLIFDPAGNLYGTTAVGGERSGCDGSGCGVVFELSPTTSGPWTETKIHVFTEGNQLDGFYPIGGLLRDSSGNFYGEANSGGTFGGVIFKASLISGIWHYGLVFSFGSNGGEGPIGGLISDSSGNLYGTASVGGANNAGVVFEITP